MFPTTRDRLNEAVRATGLGTNRFRLLGPYEYKPALSAVAERFLDVGQKGVGYSWWWEHFKDDTVSFQVENAFTLLPRLIPCNQPLWFIAEDCQNERAKFWVCEADLEAIVQVIAQSSPFEYYIVSKKLDWLLCENHHDVLIAVGAPMVEALSRLRAAA